jgi:hypothetical protein
MGARQMIADMKWSENDKAYVEILRKFRFITAGEDRL